MEHNLLSSAVKGAVFLTFTLLFCFIAVHIVRLALLGWKYSLTKKGSPQAPKEKEAPSKTAPLSSSSSTSSSSSSPTSSPEPIYYIVERKRKPKKRIKSEYSEPKQIKFQ